MMDYPDWHDDQRKVVIQLDDGTKEYGHLELFDEGWDGESEYPIYYIKTDKRTIKYFNFDDVEFTED